MIVPAVVNVGGYTDRTRMIPAGPAVEPPARRTGQGFDVARFRHAPAACVEPSLVGCVDDTHADVPLRRRVVAKAVQFVQEAEASVGHSSKVTAGCTDTTLTLGFASLEVVQLERQLSSRTLYSRGPRAWREVVAPLTRVVSNCASTPTVRPTYSSSTTPTSSSLTASRKLRHGPHQQPEQGKLRLWRGDRMWTCPATTTTLRRTLALGSQTLTMGRRPRTRQDSELAESLSLVRSHKSFCSNA